jgi:hypothetical protein
LRSSCRHRLASAEVGVRQLRRQYLQRTVSLAQRPPEHVGDAFPDHRTVQLPAVWCPVDREIGHHHQQVGDLVARLENRRDRCQAMPVGFERIEPAVDVLDRLGT